MKFYTKQHKYYCGVDLHARSIYLCILNESGDVVYHRNHRAEPEQFLKAINPFREDLVVAVECMFCWYRVADLCPEHGIKFILGPKNLSLFLGWTCPVYESHPWR